MEYRCSFCKRLLDNAEDPYSVDCGGDCVKCMAEVVQDPDCIKHLEEIEKRVK